MTGPAALDKILKNHNPFCAYYIATGDRHCSCGRDLALVELARLRSLEQKMQPFLLKEPEKSSEQ